MKYLGSKAPIVADFIGLFEEKRQPGQLYVEPFLGGCNSFEWFENPRLGADSNTYVIAMWQELRSGWVPPYFTREDYTIIRENRYKGVYPDHIIGWVGIACSYCGLWFAGFSGITETKQGTRNYQDEAFRSAQRTVVRLEGAEIKASDYRDLEIPDGSFVYCDPPYGNRRRYKEKFDSAAFWRWAADLSERCTVIISEYNAPSGWRCIWSATVSSRLSANGLYGGNRVSKEKMFIRA